MKTLICPTCGCSLVRLGVAKDQAAVYNHNSKEYRFCCQACVDLFTTDPQKSLQESNDLIVCPTCLAEKPRQLAVELKIAEQDVYYCRSLGEEAKQLKQLINGQWIYPPKGDRDAILAASHIDARPWDGSSLGL